LSDVSKKSQEALGKYVCYFIIVEYDPPLLHL
jgi:hypothetical protein